EDHHQRLTGERLVDDPTLALHLILQDATGFEYAAQILCRHFGEIEKMADALAAQWIPTHFAGSPRWARLSSVRVAARSGRAMASAISGSPTMSGGSNRTTFSPAATVNRPSARAASTRSPGGTSARKPIRKPSPRTSAMTAGCRSLS